jgi:hypothetical protein
MQYVPIDLRILCLHLNLSSHIQSHNHFNDISPLVRPNQRKKWEEFAWANRGTLMSALLLLLLLHVDSTAFVSLWNAIERFFSRLGKSKHETSRIRSKLLREDFV